VSSQRESEGHGRIEVSAADVAHRVDPEHDHQSEADRHPDVSELAGFRVDHHRAATGEDERKRSDRFRDERTRK
jgi:hypothetical protein